MVERLYSWVFQSGQKHREQALENSIRDIDAKNSVLNPSTNAGINIIADKSLPALKQTITAHMDKVKLGEFLRYAGRNYDLQFQVSDELVFVVDAKDPKRLVEETRFYRLRKGFVLPA